MKLVLAHEALEYCAKATEAERHSDDPVLSPEQREVVCAIYVAAATTLAAWSATVASPEGLPAPPKFPIPTWLAEMAGYV